MNIRAIIVLGVASATGAHAQVLRLSIDHALAHPLDGIGLPTTFGGEGHVGMVQFDLSPDSIVEGLFIQPKGGGAFAFAGGQGCSLISKTTLATDGSCIVTGSTNYLDINAGVSLSGFVLPCSGAIQSNPLGWFNADVDVASTFFGQPTFCGVDVSGWFNAQGVAGLSGWLEVAINMPAGADEGTANLDLYLIVPAPASVAVMGMALVLGRRRR